MSIRKVSFHSVAIVTCHNPDLSVPSDAVYLSTQGVSSLPHGKKFPSDIFKMKRNLKSPGPFRQLDFYIRCALTDDLTWSLGKELNHKYLGTLEISFCPAEPLTYLQK